MKTTRYAVTREVTQDGRHTGSWIATVQTIGGRRIIGSGDTAREASREARDYLDYMAEMMGAQAGAF